MNVLFLLIFVGFSEGFVKYESVKREIDLTKQLVRIINHIVLKNDEANTEINSFEWTAVSTGKLAFISVVDENEQLFDIQCIEEFQKYIITLPNTLKDETISLTVNEVYIKAFVPLPMEIKQNEKQYIFYEGNCLLYTPYPVQEQTTEIKLPSNDILNYTDSDFVRKEATTITYGPFQNKSGYEYESLWIHFEHNSPFITVISLKRFIEISHWGNIAVKEEIELFHSGAKLKGPFSRLMHQSQKSSNYHCGHINTYLPSAAQDIYYNDVIGTISTSYVVDWYQYLLVQLKPRFPLFGGWKTIYTLGYNIPAYEYLQRSNNKFKLSMLFLDHVYSNMHVEKLEVKITLPLAAKDIEINFPYSVQRLPDSYVYKYFDVLGRVVLTAKKEDLVDEHMALFELYYSWNTLALLYEPMMLCLVIFVIFVAIIILPRLDFTLPVKEKVLERTKKQLKIN